MKSRYTRLKGWVLLLAAGFLLGGCGRVPETKTILLPENLQKEEAALEETPSGYTVQKMYSRDFTTFLGMERAAFLQNVEEHRVRLLTAGEEWEADSDLMDYRYGFYETEYTVSGDKMMYVWEWWNTENGNRAHGLQQFLSPDGTKLLFPTRLYSYKGAQLYLLDLESGEQILLLDGDEMRYPGDEYFIVANWSRDASLVAYGFFPRDSDVWNRDLKKEKPYYLYLWDLKKNESAGVLCYSLVNEGGELVSRDWDLTGTKLYVERAGQEVLAGFVTEEFTEQKNASYTGSVMVDVFSYTIPEAGTVPGRAAEEALADVEWSSVPKAPAFHVDGPFGELWMDAETGKCYLLSSVEGILAFDVESGKFEESNPVGGTDYGTEITHFLVLDEGETFLTAERTMDSESEDIYIYERDGENRNRRLLCKYAGAVLNLEYQEEGRRLLIETGELAEAGGYMWSVERKAMVLEFE